MAVTPSRQRPLAGRWAAIGAITAAVAAAALLAYGLAASPEDGPAHTRPSIAGTQAGSTATHGSAPLAQVRSTERDFFSARQRSGAGDPADPLLVDGLRDTLEALLLEAGEAPDPATLKQRLAGLVGRHFPGAWAARALALAERYVDYRVALGQVASPRDPTDPSALREALQARHAVRQRFFDGPEYDALFAREAELDRYALARLEIARNPQLTEGERAQALRDAEAELPPARRAERAAATEHLAAAAQTAAFDAQNIDERTRHAARSAQYGETAARALADLDREEQQWQQRLDQYSGMLARQGDGAAARQLREQLFSPEEQLRLPAALALRRPAAGPAGAGG